MVDKPKNPVPRPPTPGFTGWNVRNFDLRPPKQTPDQGPSILGWLGSLFGRGPKGHDVDRKLFGWKRRIIFDDIERGRETKARTTKEGAVPYFYHGDAQRQLESDGTENIAAFLNRKLSLLNFISVKTSPRGIVARRNKYQFMAGWMDHALGGSMWPSLRQLGLKTTIRPANMANISFDRIAAMVNSDPQRTRKKLEETMKFHLSRGEDERKSYDDLYSDTLTYFGLAYLDRWSRERLLPALAKAGGRKLSDLLLQGYRSGQSFSQMMSRLTPGERERFFRNYVERNPDLSDLEKNGFHNVLMNQRAVDSQLDDDIRPTLAFAFATASLPTLAQQLGQEEAERKYGKIPDDARSSEDSGSGTPPLPTPEPEPAGGPAREEPVEPSRSPFSPTRGRAPDEEPPERAEPAPPHTPGPLRSRDDVPAWMKRRAPDESHEEPAEEVPLPPLVQRPERSRPPGASSESRSGSVQPPPAQPPSFRRARRAEPETLTGDALQERVLGPLVPDEEDERPLAGDARSSRGDDSSSGLLPPPLAFPHVGPPPARVEPPDPFAESLSFTSPPRARSGSDFQPALPWAEAPGVIANHIPSRPREPLVPLEEAVRPTATASGRPLVSRSGPEVIDRVLTESDSESLARLDPAVVQHAADLHRQMVGVPFDFNNPTHTHPPQDMVSTGGAAPVAHALPEHVQGLVDILSHEDIRNNAEARAEIGRQLDSVREPSSIIDSRYFGIQGVGNTISDDLRASPDHFDRVIAKLADPMSRPEEEHVHSAILRGVLNHLSGANVQANQRTDAHKKNTKAIADDITELTKDGHFSFKERKDRVADNLVQAAREVRNGSDKRAITTWIMDNSRSPEFGHAISAIHPWRGEIQSNSHTAVRGRLIETARTMLRG